MNIDYSRYANALSEAFQEKSENVGAEERSKAISEAITGPFSADLVRETLAPIIQKAIGTVKDTATTTVKGAIETAKDTATKALQSAKQTAIDTVQRNVQPTINEAENIGRTALQTTEEIPMQLLRPSDEIPMELLRPDVELTMENASSSGIQSLDEMSASESLLTRLEAAAQIRNQLPDLPGLSTPEEMDQLAPMREMMGRRPQLDEGEQTRPQVEDTQPASEEVGQEITSELGEEAGAEAGEEAGAEVGGAVAKSIGGDLADLAEGSSILDEIPGGAVVTGILALGSIFAGIFGHANEAQSINPSSQFGVGF